MLVTRSNQAFSSDLGLVSEAPGEPRTLFRPNEVAILSRSYSVCVQSGLGAGMGYTDQDYETSGARIVGEPEAWQARLVAQFKAPPVARLPLLGRSSTIAAVMHAEGKSDLVDALIATRARAIALEYLTIDGKTHPIMSATGEIAGYQAITYAAYHLQCPQSGHGRLFGAVPPSLGARVLILGFGHVGRAAARAASGLGAQVRVVHWDKRERCVCGYDCTDVGDPAVEAIIAESDVVIGALRISTFDSPTIVTASAVSGMRPGSVLVDVTAGYGAGAFETSSELTTLDDPVRVARGVTHIKIRNLPRATPVECVARVSTVFEPIVAQLLAIPEPAWISSGLITEQGRVVHNEIRRHFPELAPG